MLLKVMFNTEQAMEALKFLSANSDYYGIDIIGMNEGSDTKSPSMMLNTSRKFIHEVLELTEHQKFGMDTVWLHTLDS